MVIKKLLRNRLLVKPIIEEIKSSGGIAIPLTVNSVSTIKAEVIMLGQGSMSGEWWLKEGDIINMDNPIHATKKPEEVEHNNEKCLIIHEDEVNYVL